MMRAVSALVLLSSCGQPESPLDTAPPAGDSWSVQPRDADGDGLLARVDCDDLDPDVGAPVPLYIDQDGDGYGATETVGCPSAPGLSWVGGDCDDSRADVNPGAPEVCDDGDVDEDCDGLADDDDDSVTGRYDWFIDQDQDGVGVGEAMFHQCANPGGLSTRGDDCDDEDAAVYPDAPELCDGRANGCQVEWDETGALSFESAEGVWTAAPDIGTPERPATLHADEDGVWHVCPGTFYVSFSSVQPVSLVFQGSGADSSVLSGAGQGQVFNFQNDEVHVLLKDLSVRDGLGAEGGALFQRGGTLGVEGCRLEDNEATETGGALHSHALLTIADTVVSGNRAPLGGGLYLDGSGMQGATLEETTISGNTASQDGGGIYAEYGPSQVLRACRIEGNTAGGMGGGVVASDMTLTDTWVTDNVASSMGGGVVGGFVDCLVSAPGLGGVTGNRVAEDGGGAAVLDGVLTSVGCDWGSPDGDDNAPGDVVNVRYDGSVDTLDVDGREDFSCRMFSGCALTEP